MGQDGKASLFLRKGFRQLSFYKQGIVVIFKREDLPGRAALCRPGVGPIRSGRGKAAFQPGKTAGRLRKAFAERSGEQRRRFARVYGAGRENGVKKEGVSLRFSDHPGVLSGKIPDVFR